MVTQTFKVSPLECPGRINKRIGQGPLLHPSSQSSDSVETQDVAYMYRMFSYTYEKDKADTADLLSNQLPGSGARTEDASCRCQASLR